MTYADLMRIRYGSSQGAEGMNEFRYCKDCNTVLQANPLMPIMVGGDCIVCAFHRERELRQEVRSTARSAMGFAERVGSYKKSERAFKDFLLEVREFFEEDEFIQMCRDYYNADWES